ncbi:MAG: hypothetical protein M3209_09370 [Acidobacteriota bacterium]|nr:hypothetical protein [Acidobacteriota bacterium]
MENFVRFNFDSRNWENVLQKAIERRPLVGPAEHSASCAAYFVRGSAGDFYRVLFAGDENGDPWFRCTAPNGSHCPGFAQGWHCYHVAAALLCHIGLVSSGLRAPVSSFVSSVPSGAEEIDAVFLLTDEEIETEADSWYRQKTSEENLRRAFDTD